MHLYQEHILDHYHNPRHSGHCTDATHHADAHNPSCGDTLAIDLVIDDDVIVNGAFTGDGCAISQAAASILLDYVIGKSVETLEKMDASAMIKLLDVPLSPARIKCGLLALETAHKALHH